METAPLKSFATWARTALIREVTARITAVLAPGSTERVEQPGAVAALENAVHAAGGGDKGRASIADTVAYTWFNRIIALRFMDANGYNSIGVVSPQAGVDMGQPEILADAKRGVIDTDVVSQKTRTAVASLLDGSRASGDPQGEAYALLLADYCRHWNKAMPFMFEREGDFTELLIPANLLSDDSVLNRAVRVLTEDVCQDVEVIGWLYQFYIAEKKDEVFAGFSKGKKAGADEIPAATQLFTPHWIVRYLVENSLGRIWMLNHPNSRLIDHMDYFVAPVDTETDFLRLTSAEDLTVIDPACGSGHMLTYAFDLLYAIYEEEGYASSEIPGLILTRNLYGTELDARAGALAAFALTMKARARQRTYFSKQLRPNVCVIESISFSQDELDLMVTRQGDGVAETAFWTQFAQADTLGSLINPDPGLTARLSRHLVTLEEEGDLLKANALTKAHQVVWQANVLSRSYSVVIANPPYMGSSNMGSVLSGWIRKSWPAGKSDLYAVFLLRCLELAIADGMVAMVTMQGWMFLASYANIRETLVGETRFTSLAHLGTRAFDSISGEVVSTVAFTTQVGKGSALRGVFARVVGEPDSEAKAQTLRSIAQGQVEANRYKHLRRPGDFKRIPGWPIAYWLRESVVAAFQRFPPVGANSDPRSGMATGNNGRFLRHWHEVSWTSIGVGRESADESVAAGDRWIPYNKGGTARRWFGNNDLVVLWENDGARIKETKAANLAAGKITANNSKCWNQDRYFQQSITWSSIGTGRLSMRWSDPGSIFDTKGQCIFVEDVSRLKFYLALLNSDPVEEFLGALSPTLDFNSGSLAKIPDCFDQADVARVVALADDAIEIARRVWNSAEEAWEFEASELLLARAGEPQLVVEVVSTVIDDKENSRSELSSIEEQLDVMLYSAYEIDVPDKDDRPAPRSEPFPIPSADHLVRDLISYSVGCMLGRYSLDVPGLVLSDQGASLAEYLSKVDLPTFMPDADNVIPIVDGDWFEDDIVERFRQFLRVAFGEEHFEENLRYITETLGVKNVRDYFVRSFYKDHVQRYKKRPIYWLFSSPNGSFNTLIYMHRYTPSTVSTVLNEYLREFQAKLKASLEHAERSNNAKESDRLRKILLELDGYEHDVLYPLASQNIAIDLDDGVKVNYPKFGAALKKIVGLEASE